MQCTCVFAFASYAGYLCLKIYLIVLVVSWLPVCIEKNYALLKISLEVIMTIVQWCTIVLICEPHDMTLNSLQARPMQNAIIMKNPRHILHYIFTELMLSSVSQHAVVIVHS